MRILVYLFAIILISTSVTGEARRSGGGGSRSHGTKSVHVKGYIKKNGTYVTPHRRTSPSKTKRDNWSTKGNMNPYTGKEGTKEP